MPELPEVETVRAGLEPVLRGRRFISVEQRRKDLRFPLPERFAERLTGRTVERLDRRAKYILVHLDGGEVLAVHLGMTGRFSVQLPRTPSPRLHGVRAATARTALLSLTSPRGRAGEGIQLGEYTLRARPRRQARPPRVHDVGRGGRHLQRCAPLRLHDAWSRQTSSTTHAYFAGPRRRAAGR